MKNLIKPLCSLAIALTVGFPLPAAAAVLGTDPCARLSWNALVLGECGIGIGTEPVQSDPAEAGTSQIELVDLAPGVPEPETYALMLAGLVVVALVARRRRRD